MKYDVCIVGSGAGASPVAYTLANEGFKVLVLEKGGYFTEEDFAKDEVACVRRSFFTPNLFDEQHVIEESDGEGSWSGTRTSQSGWDFWNGNCVGGSSNFMSGFFHRLKPDDFRLKSKYGAIKGANVEDWVLSYEELEPYYDMTEKVVGVSGEVVNHKFLEPRSSQTFPFPKTYEHPIAKWFDTSMQQQGLVPLPTARAILPFAKDHRNGCAYTNYCGSYGCTTGAKSSGRAALLDKIKDFSNVTIQANSHVTKLLSNENKEISAAEYVKEGKTYQVEAKLFVVAAQAIETSRLLLNSKSKAFPHGLANNNGQVGKNLIFSAGGSGEGEFRYESFKEVDEASMKTRGLFVNRYLQDWYYIDDEKEGRMKGGTAEFLFHHANPISRALSHKWKGNNLNWGKQLKEDIKSYFTRARYFRFEIFCDWLPTDDCFVSIDKEVKDKYGMGVARVRIGAHPHDLKVGEYIAKRCEALVQKMGAQEVYSSVSPAPPQNLVAGGCRFGNNPKTSVLDKNCKAHEVNNLYVSDGSFMPTGGSVPFTFTIYANAFRVADKITQHLKKIS